MFEDDDARIREKAHALWEAEGRPHGREAQHWVEAKEIVALTDSFGSTLRPLEETLSDPVEPISAVENHGDLPELTDTGEGARGPSWSAARELAEQGGTAGAAATSNSARQSTSGD